MLRDLADRDVTAFLTAESWQVYLTVLYALLLLRRRHELAPLHADLYDNVRGAIEAIPGRNPYTSESFAGDMAQLAAWQCVRKDAEISRIRGYKDRSRENFRYTLNRDAVSFLEWLESRLEDRIHGGAHDGRDLLLDLAGRLQEILKIKNATKDKALDSDSARRILYLLEAVDDGVDSINADLTALRAEMHAFARGLAAKEDLKKVVTGLEKYAAQYVRRMRDLGSAGYKTARRLAQPSSRRVLLEAQKILEAERSFRHQSLRDPNEIIEAALPFLEPQGHLADGCSRVEQMASEVVRRVHRQLKDLEVRNFRLEEIGARLGQIASLSETDGRKATAYLEALCAFAHFRNDPFPGQDGKARPPAPRRSGDWRSRQPPAALRKKRLRVQAVFQDDEAKRRALREHARLVLGGRDRGKLSETALNPGDNPFVWLEVAKAHYLGGGRRLKRAGVAVAKAPGSATLSADGKYILSEDHELEIHNQSDE